MNIRRNEVASAIPAGSISTAIKQGAGSLALYADEDRQQRASIILKDVAYVIEAHFELRSHDSSRTRADELAKHHHIVKRRLISGQCFHQPYFGTREFAADFSWIDSHAEIPPTRIASSDQDLGFMLHDIDHGLIRTPKFFRATIRQGVIEVPSLNSPELLS
jgi:CRISPR-associated protein Cas5d